MIYAKFQSLMRMAKSMQSLDPDRADFYRGLQRGLRRLHHGENFGTADEHARYINCADGDYRRQLQLGYRTGFYHDEMRLAGADDLQTLRNLLGLSVADIAEIATVSPRTVEGWEQGRPIPQSALQLIRKFLTIS